MTNEALDKMVEEHWSYVKSLLEAHNEIEEDIPKYGFHYKSAFLHGFKHAKEDKDYIADYRQIPPTILGSYPPKTKGV